MFRRSLLRSDDAFGSLFSALEDDGERLDIRYGQLSRGEVHWHVRSHTRYDGIGGFIDVVRSLGGQVLSDVPELDDAYRGLPDPRVVHQLARLSRRPAARWRRMRGGGGSQLVLHGRPPASAWAVLDSVQTQAVRAEARRSGATFGGYLLARLNASLATSLAFSSSFSRFSRGEPALWVVPVNMRRGQRPDRHPLSNHLSFVPVRLHADDGPGAVTRRIRALLEAGAHQALAAAVRAYVALDGGASVGSLADRLGGRSVGLFSNIGAWDIAGLAGDHPPRWVFCPPVTRFLPMSAGVLTVNGAVGLMLQACPGLTMDATTVRAWLAAWIDQLTVRDDGGPASMVCTSAHSCW
jgi:hypothetical protein